MRILAVAVALLCAVSGCTSDEVKEPGPLPKVNHPKAAVPKDRDERAVVAALARLDACSLLDPRLAKTPGFPAGTPREPTGPHRCRVRATGGETYLRIGTAIHGPSRYIQQPIDLVGVKGYLNPKRCTVAIPVSFTRTIFVDPVAGVRFSATACKTAKAFAAVAAAKLTTPDAARLQAARWDACTALRQATGTQQAHLDPHDDLDRCRLSTNLADGRVELNYREQRTDFTGETVWTIGGKRAVVSQTGAVCYLTWLQARSGVPDKKRVMLEVVLTSDCAKARQLATALVKVLDGPPPATQPQHPLVYSTGEPDQARAGACIDVLQSPCEPYHQVDAPKGFTEIARRAHADPHVQCAIAVDAVRQHLGPQYRPVVAGTGDPCLFAEPTHTVELAVKVVRFGQLPSPTPAKTLTIAGRRAVLVTSKHLPEYTLSVAADGGVLELRMTLVGWLFANRPGPVNTKPVSTLEPIATGITERSL